MNKKNIYFKRLEIIRVLSCILVFLYHLNILKNGFLAVCTFFTLSGYLSYISALKNEDFSIKTYYKKRLKKIYLPLLIVVFITVIIAKLNSNINWINLKPETFSVVFGYNNFWQLNANLDYFTRTVNSPFIHLWYISILLQFELLFPIAFVLLKKVERKFKKNISTIIVILLTIASTILFCVMGKTQDVMVMYYNTFARSFSIFFGILLAIIHYKHNFKRPEILEKYHTPLFAIYNIVLIVICVFMPAEPNNYAIYMLLTTIISTRLIEYATIENTKIRKFDKHIKALSKVSYEIYLVQYPVIFFMKNVPIDDALKALIIIVLTFIISCILHLIINFPLNSEKLKSAKVIFLSVIIGFGSFVTIVEKDHSGEMKELENRLNENLKIVEEKNNEYLNTVNVENSNNNNNLNTTNVENNKEDTNRVDVEKKETNSVVENTRDQEKNIAEKVKKLPVIGVGDSVLLAAINEFYNKFPNGYFNGKISRTIAKSEDILKDLKSKGKLGDIVILCLATNGDYSDRINKELMNILGNRKVYWVDAVGADDPKFNQKFRNFASNYSNIHIVEWDKEAKNHPEYLEPDKIHPNYKGSKALVKLVYTAIYNDYLKK